ncbi:ABC transporter permease [Aliamphritea hakodatensis]|uniref:ABC transporter permease n=1 Tax=Aliamphritea hakodatensis TaxID=2895352 RepID=UPI0022FDA8E6|nr:FtsX-like permease family protein [Aliamphritea hakodatensis]
MSPIRTLAWRQFRSQWRRSDWLTLLLALFVMTSLVTLLTTTSDRIYSSLSRQGAELMGADMILSSSRPIELEQRTGSLDPALRTTTLTQFISMAETDEQNVLSTIRAVTAPYPLRGQINTQPAEHPATPDINTVWAEQALLDRLNIQLGDKIYLGYSEFTVSHVLIDSPVQGGGFSRFNPQILMRADQLEATGIMAPGSRAGFRLMIAGPQPLINELEAQWQETLPAHQRIFSASKEREIDGNAMGNANQYLKLSALMAILLGAVAILLSLQRYAADQHNRCALLLSLGLSPRQLGWLYTLQLFAGWLFAAVLGALTGYLMHELLISQLSEFIRNPAPLAISSVITSPLLALVILFALGLPTLLPLGKVTIMQMIRSDSAQRTSRWLYLLCTALLILVISLYIGSVTLPLLATTGLLILGWLAGTLAQKALLFSAAAAKHKLRLSALLTLRLRQQRHWHKLQAGVFSVLLAIMAVLLLTRNELLNQWQAQLPVDAPNNVVLNIQPWEGERFTDWLDDNQINANIYPMVRGRLTEINQQPTASVLSEEQQKHHALQRELNLTWRSALPDHNKILSGNWHGEEEGISIEAELADELGIVLGDTVGFSIAGQTLSGTVTSIREVNWDSYQPTFYLIFAPGMLDQLPATLITSFQLKPEQKHLSNALIKAFPTITLIDIDRLIVRAQGIIDKLSAAATLIMLLTLLSGGIMLVTILQQELAQRRYEGAMLQTLGASAKQTLQLDRLEFTLLGLTCGSIAILIAELLLGLINVLVFELDVTLHPWMWLSLPLIATAIFAGLGSLIRGNLSLTDSYNLLKSG